MERWLPGVNGHWWIGLPWIKTSAAGMNQEPMPVTEDLLGSVNLQNKQSIHTNDNNEERLEQMSSKKGDDGTDDPRNVEWACLVSLQTADSPWFSHEPLTFLGFAWFRTKGYGKVLLGSLGVVTGHPCASKVDMGLCRACLPQTQRVRHVRGTQPLPFLPQTRTSHGKRMRERTKPGMKLRRQPSKKNQSRCFAQDTCLDRPLPRARGLITDGYRWQRARLLQIKSPKKPIKIFVGCVLVRKAQTNTEASRDFKQVKADCDGDGPRNTWEGMRWQVHLARLWGKASCGPVTVAIPLPWTQEVVIANDSLDPLWWYYTANDSQTKPPQRTGTVIERKSTPGHQDLAAWQGASSSTQWTTVYKTAPRVWTNRENCKDPLALNAPSYPSASQTSQCPASRIRFNGSFFSGGPVTISKLKKRGGGLE